MAKSGGGIKVGVLGRDLQLGLAGKRERNGNCMYLRDLLPWWIGGGAYLTSCQPSTVACPAFSLTKGPTRVEKLWGMEALVQR